MRVAAAVALGATLVGAPSGRADTPVRLPPGFRINAFATGLGAPRILAVDPAGALVVSIPSQGRVVALPDADGDGVADRVVTLVSGLHLPHGVAFRDEGLYVAETGRIVRFRYDATALSARDPVVIVGDLPAGAHHWSRTIVFGPDGGLYVAIGSSCDVCREADRRRAAIVRYEPDGSGERLFASGMRNPFGLAFQPRTGTLWTTVNERDWRSGGAPPDYVTRVREGASYGWPDCFATARTFQPDPEFSPQRPCSDLALPTVELPAHSSPLGATFYTGRQFPAPYRGALFIALHGSRAGLPLQGYKIVRVLFDGARVPGVEDFATGWRAGDRVWGRPVDVLTAPDGGLYVSDDHAGVVHRITFGGSGR